VSITAPAIDHLILNIDTQTKVNAPIERTFAALLEQLGPGSDKPNGDPMPMTLEPWPGGRWFRDLGNGDGHFWGTVQAIKRPTLLELHGPLFLSQAVISNVQYRLTTVPGGTLLTFHHFALGAIPDDLRASIGTGWAHIANRVAARAESPR
jgi:uncharacterized protein YndB with AHSA1/START domain